MERSGKKIREYVTEFDSMWEDLLATVMSMDVDEGSIDEMVGSAGDFRRRVMGVADAMDPTPGEIGNREMKLWDVDQEPRGV